MTGPITSLTPAPLNIVVAPTPLSAGFPSPPPFDVIELLPSAAADKLRALRQRSDDLHAIIPPGEDVRLANTAKIEAANALKRLVDHPQDGGFGLGADDRRVIVATKALEKATADFERLKQLEETRSQAWRTASQAKATCADWLRHGKPGNTQLEPIETESPKLNKGESLIDGIERHRRRVRELRADLHRIESAP